MLKLQKLYDYFARAPMFFTEYLNEIYKKLDCTQSEICNASGLSAPVISRYLSGDREPSYDSEQLKALANGLSKVAALKNIDDKELSYENILNNLNKTIHKKEVLYHSFTENFNNIINSFNINIKDLANAINFDVSYLYRVRSGERHPVDLYNFSKLVSDYIVEGRNNKINELTKEFLNLTEEEVSNIELIKEKIHLYLIKENPENDDIPEMSSFLEKMEEFDLDEYIKVIHFDELKVPSIPFSLPNTKYHYGLSNMRQAELNFLKSTVLGKSMDDVYMASFMPMADMAEDMDFGKKWMFGIAMMIKKGLHLNVIHNLDRPMHELMLGFEAWIPIYMTGQVSPFYIPDYKGDLIRQINYSSGSSALMGECIDGFHDKGRYLVTNNKSDISYFRKKAKALFKKAKPLMDVYTENEHDKFDSFLQRNAKVWGNRKVISSLLPEFLIPSDILENHLSDIDSREKDRILNYIESEKSDFYNILKNNSVTWDYTYPSKEEYEKNPSVLAFPTVFSKINKALSYEEYLSHLKACKEYEHSNPNFVLNQVDIIPFSNIKISIIYGKYFIITKSKSPNIHFVIYHKTMLKGMENFYLAYNEKETQ